MVTPVGESPGGGCSLGLGGGSPVEVPETGVGRHYSGWAVTVVCKGRVGLTFFNPYWCSTVVSKGGQVGNEQWCSRNGGWVINSTFQQFCPRVGGAESSILGKGQPDAKCPAILG